MNLSIRAFNTHQPEIHESVYIDPQSCVIGRVSIGQYCSVWPMAVIRGDVNYISIGEYCNIQDGAVLHVTHAGPFTTSSGYPLIIGREVTVGHSAVLHACTIGDRCLIGMNATILDGAILEENTLIAAGSLVPPKKHLPAGFLWAGSPIKRMRALTEKELEYFSYSAKHYQKLASQYQS